MVMCYKVLSVRQGTSLVVVGRGGKTANTFASFAASWAFEVITGGGGEKAQLS